MPAIRFENNGRFIGRTIALRPDDSTWEEDDSDADWEDREPADDELRDEHDDLDWWLDDEPESESPLETDWPEEDDEPV